MASSKLSWRRGGSVWCLEAMPNSSDSTPVLRGSFCLKIVHPVLSLTVRSVVTCHTVLPNKAPNPTLSEVRQSLPLDSAQERMCALVLDVSKAHRRVRIRPADQGLLCFRHRGRLYRSLTLNFGARASGFYWNRVSGLLVRLLHRLVFSAHSALIYVDDYGTVRAEFCSGLDLPHCRRHLNPECADELAQSSFVNASRVDWMAVRL